MNSISVYENVVAVLAEVTMQDKTRIARETQLDADLGIDSIMLAGLIAKFHHLVHQRSDMNACVSALLSARTVGEVVAILDEEGSQ